MSEVTTIQSTSTTCKNAQVDQVSSAQESGSTLGAHSQYENEIYLEERKSLCNAEFDAAKRFDHWVITVSGGVLALSMTLYRDVLAHRPSVAPWLIISSWICFGMAVTLILICILLSQRAFEKYRHALDKAFEAQASDPLSRAKTLQAQRWEPSAIEWLNRFSIFFFVAGIVLLSCFVWNNLNIEEFDNAKSGARELWKKDTGQREASDRANLTAPDPQGKWRVRSESARVADEPTQGTTKSGEVRMNDESVHMTPATSTTQPTHTESAKPPTAPVGRPVNSPDVVDTPTTTPTSTSAPSNNNPTTQGTGG